MFSNDGLATVTSGGTTTSDTSWTVSITQAFPSPTTGQQFHVADVASGFTTEKITVGAGNSGAVGTQTWTVVRGAEGSTALSHTAGFTIRQVVTAGAMGNLVDLATAQTEQNKTLQTWAETLATQSSVSGTATVNLNNGNAQQLTLTGNVTGFTFSNVPAAGAVRLTLYLVQDATGGRTVTWPGSVTWLGAQPVINTAANGVTGVVLQTLNGGTGWYGEPLTGGPSLPLAIASGGTGSATQNFANLLTPTATKTSAYTAQPGDLVPCDISGGSFTVTLTAAPTGTQPTVAVRVVTAGTGNLLTVLTGGSGGTQDVFESGGTTRTLGVRGAAIVMQYTPGGGGPPGMWNILDAGPRVPFTTLGDLLYADATPSLARLAGNTTSTKNFLTQTGNGTISAAPAWGTISAGDVPDLAYVDSVSAGDSSITVAGATDTPAVSSVPGQLIQRILCV